MITLRAPTDAEILTLVIDLLVPQTLLGLAARLWPLPLPTLCRTLYRFQGEPVPLSPTELLRRRARSLSRCGHLVVRPCPGGLRCHGSRPGTCPLILVERAPWPRLSLGPTWTTARHSGPPELVVEVVQCSQGDSLGLGRVYTGGEPAGTVQVLGHSEGIELVFTALPGREHLQPPFHALLALEAALQDRLRSRLPPGALAAMDRALSPIAPAPRPSLLDPAERWDLGEISRILVERCGYSPELAQAQARQVTSGKVVGHA